MVEHIEGLIAAPFTPMDKDGRVKYELVGDYANFLKRNGVIGVFVNGSSGESLSLSLDERMKLAELWMEHSSKDFKVLIHVGHSSVEEAKKLAKHAQDIGAWAIGAMAPVFFKPKTIESLVGHCSLEASAAPNTPYYYYNIPVRTGVTFNMHEFLTKAEDKIPNLAGIKFTHNDLVDFSMCVEYKGGKFDILHGFDETLVTGLLFGAKGAIGSTYNFASKLYNEIITEFRKGNLNKAVELQRTSMKMIISMFSTGKFHASCKAILNFAGLDIGYVRSPNDNLTSAEVAKLRDVLENQGIFEYLSK